MLALAQIGTSDSGKMLSLDTSAAVVGSGGEEGLVGVVVVVAVVAVVRIGEVDWRSRVMNSRSVLLEACSAGEVSSFSSCLLRGEGRKDVQYEGTKKEKEQQKGE